MVLGSLAISIIVLKAKFGESLYPILNWDNCYGHSEFAKLGQIINCNVALIFEFT
jgi:hypothetical protein